MKFAMTGYSQGADVIHHSLQELDGLQERIAGIAMFGDPLTSVGFPPAYEGRVYNVCHEGDRACGGEGTIGHLGYGRLPAAYEPAVNFLVERLGADSLPVQVILDRRWRRCLPPVRRLIS